MGFQLFNTGEEMLQKHFFTDEVTRPADCTVLLYNDGATGGDGLTDTNDAGDVTTEPTDGNYQRQSLTFGTTDFSAALSSGDWTVTLNDLVYDVTNTTGTIDAGMVVVNVALGGDGGTATDHALFNFSVGGTYNLGDYTQFTVQNASLSQT